MRAASGTKRKRMTDAKVEKKTEQTLGAIATSFALAVQREINIRNGCFVPHTEQEKTWKDIGAVAVKNLDTVMEYIDG